MTFGVVGATGAAGAAGPLSGLTCGADEFAASFNGVWKCAILGVTLDGIFSGGGIGECCSINNYVTLQGYTSIGFNTSAHCNHIECDFEVVGVADHTVCTLSGSSGTNSFNTASNGVTVTANGINVDWTLATGFNLVNPQGALNVQVSCGQGVVEAT
jgi:hypothetical protein